MTFEFQRKSGIVQMPDFFFDMRVPGENVLVKGVEPDANYLITKI